MEVFCDWHWSVTTTVVPECSKAECPWQVEEKEAIVSAQQKAYEQVRTERNVYSRDLIAAQAEVAEAKRRLATVVSSLHILYTLNAFIVHALKRLQTSGKHYARWTASCDGESRQQMLLEPF